MLVVHTAIAAFAILGAPNSGPDIDRAQRLYEKAKYEEALQALPPGCQPDPVACYRLKGLIHIALGDEASARDSFSSLLEADPGAQLGTEVSPKVQALFSEARDNAQLVSDLSLEPPTAAMTGAPVLLELRDPIEVEVTAITVFVHPADIDEDRPEGASLTAADPVFVGIPLELRGSVWSGQIQPAGSSIRYFMELRLSSGRSLEVGSSRAPKSVELGWGADSEGGDNPAEVPGPTTGLEPDPKNGEGLPDWAFWGLIGGGAAVVVTAVVLAVVLTRDDEPGTVRVTIDYDE